MLGNIFLHLCAAVPEIPSSIFSPHPFPLQAEPLGTGIYTECRHRVTSLANALLYLHQWLPTFPPRNPKLHTREILWLWGSKVAHIFSKWWVLHVRIITRILNLKLHLFFTQCFYAQRLCHPLTDSGRNKDRPAGLWLLLLTLASRCSWPSRWIFLAVVSCPSNPLPPEKKSYLSLYFVSFGYKAKKSLKWFFMIFYLIPEKNYFPCWPGVATSKVANVAEWLFSVIYLCGSTAILLKLTCGNNV